MAEIELNVLMGQYLNRRIATMEEIEKEVKGHHRTIQSNP